MVWRRQKDRPRRSGWHSSARQVGGCCQRRRLGQWSYCWRCCWCWPGSGAVWAAAAALRLLAGSNAAGLGGCWPLLRSSRSPYCHGPWLRCRLLQMLRCGRQLLRHRPLLLRRCRCSSRRVCRRRACRRCCSLLPARGLGLDAAEQLLRGASDQGAGAAVSQAARVRGVVSGHRGQAAYVAARLRAMLAQAPRPLRATLLHSHAPKNAPRPTPPTPAPRSPHAPPRCWPPTATPPAAPPAAPRPPAAAPARPWRRPLRGPGPQTSQRRP